MTSRENKRANFPFLTLELAGFTRFHVMPRVTITVPEKNAQPYRFHLDREVVTLGRGSDNDIPIDCGSVSVKHAEMRRITGGYELRDAGSTNGIKLADERYDVIPLRNGISVRLGDVAFDFMLTDEELQTLAREKPAEEPAAPAVFVDPAKSLPKLPPMVDPHDPHEPHARPSASLPASREIGGYGMLLILLLALLAFWIGMSIRFHKETGRSLINAIRTNRQSVHAPASKPAPEAPAATTDTPAPDTPAPDAPATDMPTPDVPSPDVPAPDATMAPDNAAPGSTPAAGDPPP